MECYKTEFYTVLGMAPVQYILQVSQVLFKTLAIFKIPLEIWKCLKINQVPLKGLVSSPVLHFM